MAQCKHDLLSYYLRLEQYYMEESVAKAVAMDSLEPSQQTSSMVDDTFFIIRKCIRWVLNNIKVEEVFITNSKLIGNFLVDIAVYSVLNKKYKLF